MNETFRELGRLQYQLMSASHIVKGMGERWEKQEDPNLFMAEYFYEKALEFIKDSTFGDSPEVMAEFQEPLDRVQIKLGKKPKKLGWGWM